MNAEECRKVLGITPGASSDDIKQAYRDLVKIWHPDRFSHDPRLQSIAEERLKQINLAYGTLSRLSHEMPSRRTPQRDGGKGKHEQAHDRAERVRQELERQRHYREERTRRQREHEEKYWKGEALERAVRPRHVKVLFAMAIVTAGLALLILLTHAAESWRIERLTEAAERGDVKAQFSLGAAYFDGRGVERNYVRAYMWFTVASSRGGREALKARDKVGKLMTAAQIAKGKAMASRWKPKAGPAGKLGSSSEVEISLDRNRSGPGVDSPAPIE